MNDEVKKRLEVRAAIAPISSRPGLERGGNSEIQRAVITLLEQKERPFEILGFGDQTEVKELPPGMGVVTLSFPISARDGVKRMVARTDLMRTLSLTPTVISDEDKFSSMTGLVTSVDSAIALPEYLKEYHLPFHQKADFKGVKLLQAKGAVGVIHENEAKNGTNGSDNGWMGMKGKSIIPVPWPKMGWMGEVQEKEIQSPRLGPCSYLIIDQNQLNFSDPEISRRLIGEISVLAGSKDFHFSFDQLGNMVVVALNEKSVGKLTQTGLNLQKISGKAHLYLGKGEIAGNDVDSLIIKGYTPKYDLTMWMEEGKENPGFFSSEGNLGEIHNSRDESFVVVTETEKVAGGLLSKIEVTRKVNLNVGHGPDRHIGYEEEKSRLSEALSPESDTRLVFLEGHAGTGKSRLIDEVTKKMDGLLVVAMDPAGRGIPGFSLANLVDQVASFLEKNKELTDEMPGISRALAEFAGKDENDKLAEINGPGGSFILEYCSMALLTLAEKLPNFILVIDDLHHIDRYSDGPIMKMVQDLAESPFGSCKTVLSRRPEARYASLEQDELMKNVPSAKIISLHDEEGNLKLNFRDSVTARDYIFHSLPEELQINKEDFSPRVLGGWAEELGKIANTPFEMTSFMQSLLQNPEMNFLKLKDRIELTPEGEEQLSKIRGKELKLYHLERIRELLSPQETMALQAIAIVGARMASEVQLVNMLEKSFGIKEAEGLQILENLERNGYLKVREKEKATQQGNITMNHYSIWHENIRDIVLNNTMDEKQKADISYKLLNSLGGFSNISSLQFFSVMHSASLGRNEDEKDFWKYYGIFAEASFSQAKGKKLYAEGYEVGVAVLHNLDMEKNQGRATTEALKKMQQGESVPEALAKVLEAALLALAENGLFLGKFEQVYAATKIAEDIYGGKGEQKAKLQKFYRLGFEAVLVESKPGVKTLQHYYDLIDQSLLDDAGRMQLQLKFAFRKGDGETCKKIFDEIAKMEEIPVEIRRMKVRVELEEILDEQKKKGIDGDASLSGVNLDDLQKRRLRVLDCQIADIRKEWYGKASTEAKTQRLTPIDELQILSLEGQIAAMLGDYDRSIGLFRECWRVAMQLKVYPAALRAAKEKGDVEIFMALKQFNNVRNLPNTMGDKIDLQAWFWAEKKARSNGEYRRLLKGAVETYSEEGLKVAEKVGDEWWKFLHSIERLRATCMYLDSQDENELTTLAPSLRRYVEMGVADLEAIHGKMGLNFIPAGSFKDNKPEDYEMCYYVTPLIKWFKKILMRSEIIVKQGEVAKEGQKAFRIDDIGILGNSITIVRLGEMAYETEETVTGAKAFSIDIMQDRLNERGRKLQAFY